MSILSHGNLFAERILFWVMFARENAEWVLNHLTVALPKNQIGLVFGSVLSANQASCENLQTLYQHHKIPIRCLGAEMGSFCI
jgi:hypothetical protein